MYKCPRQIYEPIKNHKITARLLHDQIFACHPTFLHKMEDEQLWTKHIQSLGEQKSCNIDTSHLHLTIIQTLFCNADKPHIGLTSYYTSEISDAT